MEIQDGTLEYALSLAVSDESGAQWASLTLRASPPLQVSQQRRFGNWINFHHQVETNFFYWAWLNRKFPSLAPDEGNSYTFRNVSFSNHQCNRQYPE
jgi:hypothetical protein